MEKNQPSGSTCVAWASRAASRRPNQSATGHGRQREAPLRQRRQRVTLGEAGVDEAEPVLADAEDGPGAVHLGPADLGDVVLDVLAVLQRGVEDAAPLATGAGDDEDVHALV